MGDQINLPMDLCEGNMQHKRLHEEGSQPFEQLQEVIEEIRMFMVKSSQEATSEENLRRRNPAIAAGKPQ
jgi:hypothetical protein